MTEESNQNTPKDVESATIGGLDSLKAEAASGSGDLFPGIESSQDEASQVAAENKVKQGAHHKVPARKRMITLKRIAIIVGGAIVGLLILCAIVLVIILNVGKSQLQEPTSSWAGKKIEYNGKKYQFNNNIVTVCFLGWDKDVKYDANGELFSNGQADGLVVFAINTQDNSVKGIVVSRNTMADIDYFDNGVYQGMVKNQISLAFADGKTLEESSQLQCAALSRLFYGIPLETYLTFDKDQIAGFADDIGGVKLVAIEDVAYSDEVKVAKGEEVTLTGALARMYVHRRDWSKEAPITTPLDRQARQVQFIKEFAKQAIPAIEEKPERAVQLFERLKASTTTNITLPEFAYLASVLVQGKASNFELISLEGTMKFNLNENMFAQFILDKEFLMQTIIDTFYTPVNE